MLTSEVDGDGVCERAFDLFGQQTIRSTKHIPMNQDNEIQGTAGTFHPVVSTKWIWPQPILKAVRKAGYETPQSPIQECAIPPLLEGKDFSG